MTRKIGDTVRPKIGPYAGIEHKITHIHDDGSYNIKPVNINRGIKYKQGSGRISDKNLHEESLDEISLDGVSARGIPKPENETRREKKIRFARIIAKNMMENVNESSFTHANDEQSEDRGLTHTMKHGEIRWTNKEGKLHHPSQPARESWIGTKFHYDNGILHRTNGPAIYNHNTELKRWFLNGKEVTERQHKNAMKKTKTNEEFNSKLVEDAPTNNVGGGHIASVGVGPQGEPGVRKAVIARIRRRNAIEFRKYKNKK